MGMPGTVGAVAGPAVPVDGPLFGALPPVVPGAGAPVAPAAAAGMISQTTSPVSGSMY
jgi:hypothetical protein